MVDENDPTNPDEPTDPVDPLQTIAYVCFYSYPGRPGRYGAINAYTEEQAWDIAWANCEGTKWVPTRIFLQPVWTGNAVSPEGHGTVAEY